MKVTHRVHPIKNKQVSFHSLGASESPRWRPLHGLLNISLLFAAAGRLPGDGDPVAADSGLEHGDPAVQPGSVPRGREVVRPRHGLHPPPRIAAGELRDTGTGLVGGVNQPDRNTRLINEVYHHHCRPFRANTFTGSTGFSRVPQMSGLYTEILDRLDKAQKNLAMEE